MNYFKLTILVAVISLFFTNYLHAKAFKCLSNGKVSYQSNPCENADKTTELHIKINKTTPLQACLATCESENSICSAKLANPTFNNDGTGALKVCRLKQEWCDSVCRNLKESRIIEKKYDYLSAKRSYELKRKFDKIDNDARIDKNKRYSEYYNQTKSSCFDDGMKEIKKVQSSVLAWEIEKKM